MIYNGVSSRYYKILRLNMFNGVLVVVFNIHLLSMLILRLMNKKMTGLQHQMSMVIIYNQHILLLLLMQVLKLLLDIQYKMYKIGLLVLVVPKLLEDLEWHSKYTIETQDQLMEMYIKKFKKKQKLYSPPLQRYQKIILDNE